MAKEIKRVELQLKISQGDHVDQRVLRQSERLTIGRDRDNDIVLSGEEFPKKHALFTRAGSGYIAALLSNMSGEIFIGDSLLRFIDLIKHGLLQRRGDSYILRIWPGKQGIVHIDKIVIEFYCQVVTVEALPPAAELSWPSAVVRSVQEDPLFKLVFASLLVGMAFFISKIAGMELLERKPVDLEKVPQRFASLIIQTEAERVVVSDAGTAALPAEENARREGTSERSEGERSESGATSGSERKVPPITAQGLLGLISGSGESSRGGSIVDVLMDRGLVRELAEVAGETNLKLGRPNGSPDAKSDGLKELLDATASGGIDDLLVGLDDSKPTIDLKKEGQVEVERTGSIREDAEVIGRRDEQSLASVVSMHKPRIQYIYNKYLKLNPNLEGKVSMDIYIAASGRVERVVVVEETVGNLEFINELKNTILRQWRYDPIERGTVVVNYPFVFTRPIR